MPSLRLVASAPLLIATCTGPCAEFPPELAVLNRVGAPIDVTLDEQTLAEALPDGEGSAFVVISEGAPSGDLVVRQGDETLQLRLSSLVPSATDSGCYVIIVEPCLEAPLKMCAIAVQTPWDDFELSCRHARQVMDADTDSGTDTDLGTGTQGDAGTAPAASSSG